MYNVMKDFVSIDGMNNVTYSIKSSDSNLVLRDVSVDMKTAYRFADILNTNQVSEVHAFDVIEDLLP